MIVTIKKTLKIISFLFVLFFLFGTLVSVSGTADILLQFVRMVHKGELKFTAIRILCAIFVILITVWTCIIGARMAKKKNRSIINWIIICFFTNIWGLIILHYLPENMKIKVKSAR